MPKFDWLYRFKMDALCLMCEANSGIRSQLFQTYSRYTAKGNQVEPYAPVLFAIKLLKGINSNKMFLDNFVICTCMIEDVF